VLSSSGSSNPRKILFLEMLELRYARNWMWRYSHSQYKIWCVTNGHIGCKL